MLLAARTIPGVEYIALADQDDFWLPTKLEVATRTLAAIEFRRPGLYCSALTLVDESLTLSKSYRFRHAIGLNTLLVANCATGCTVVLNRALLDRLHPLPEPAAVWMHDWWLALVASALGSVVYDPESLTLYRQHGGNQIGLPTGPWDRLRRAWRSRRRVSGPTRLSQAQALFDLYQADLKGRDRTLLRQFLRGRRSLLARTRFAAFQWPPRGELLFGLLARLAFVRGRH